MEKIFEYLITADDDTTVADSSGRNKPLTVISGGDSGFVSDARGYGWQSPTTNNSSGASLRRTLDEDDAAALNGLKQFVLIFPRKAGAAGSGSAYTASTIFAIGDESDIQMNIRTLSAGSTIRVQFDNGNIRRAEATAPIGPVALVFDTDAETQAGRVRMVRRPYDGANSSPSLTFGAEEIPQGWTFNIEPGVTQMVLGNSIAGNQNGIIQFGAFLFLGGPVSNDQIYAIFDELEESDDVTPIILPPPVLSDPSVTDLQPTTATANITTDIGSGTIYALYSTNATELAATIKGGVSQAVTEAGVQSINLTGLPLGEAGYVHFIQAANGQDSNIVSHGFTTASKMTQSTTATVALPAGYNMVELSGELYTRGLTQLQRTPQPGWQMIGQTSEIEWAADGSAQVKKIDAPFNVWIADELGKLSRIVYDATGLSAAVFPETPTLADATNQEPGAEVTRSFTLSVPDNQEEPVNVQAVGVGATITINDGEPVSSGVAYHGDTITVTGYASIEFGAAEVCGVEMSGGVAAYFTITTRAPLSPVITEHLSSQTVTVGIAAAFSFGVTGAASQQFYERINGVDTIMPGQTGTTLTITNAQLADSGRQFFAIATHAEGGTVRTPETGYASLTVVAAATRLQLPAGLRNVDGSSLAGQTITVDVHEADTVNSRVGAFLYRTTILIPLTGPANIDNNQNGVAGTVRAVCRPQTSALGTSVPALFIAAQAVP